MTTRKPSTTTRKPSTPKPAAPKPSRAEAMIEQVRKNEKHSAREAAELTKVLHEEKLLPERLAIRLRRLFWDFDIVNEEFLRGADMTYQRQAGDLTDLLKILEAVRSEFTDD